MSMTNSSGPSVLTILLWTIILLLHYSVAISAANEQGFGATAISFGRTQSIGKHQSYSVISYGNIT